MEAEESSLEISRKLEHALSGLQDSDTQLQRDLTEKERLELFTRSQSFIDNIERCLEKTSELDRFDEIPFELLNSVKQSCLEAAVADHFTHLDREKNDSEAIDQNVMIQTSLELRRSIIALIITNFADTKEHLPSEDDLPKMLSRIKLAIDTIDIILSSSLSNDEEKILGKARKNFSDVLSATARMMCLLVERLTKSGMDESSVTTLEFCALKLICSEWSQYGLEIDHTKELQRSAVAIVVAVFSQCPAHRTFLFGELLLGMRRMATSGRIIITSNKSSIHILSALTMEFLQSYTRPTLNSKDLGKVVHPNDQNPSEHEVEHVTQEQAVSDLSYMIRSIYDPASSNAILVARVLVDGMQETSAQRKSLKIVVEDLLTALDMPRWPAATLLIRAILIYITSMIKDPKRSVGARSTAIEILGAIGSAICQLHSQLQNRAHRLRIPQKNPHLLTWNGSHRSVTEHLWAQKSVGLYPASAWQHYLLQWAKGICCGMEEGDQIEMHAIELRQMLLQPSWTPPSQTASVHEQVCHRWIVLNSDHPLQRRNLLNVLLRATHSGGGVLCSRALKGVLAMVSEDSSMLDDFKDLRLLVKHCARDSSSLVHENIIALIGKAVSLRPGLQRELVSDLLDFTRDPVVGVRRRAIVMLQQIYVQETCKITQAKIVAVLLQRTNDDDSGIMDLSRRVLEDICISPFLLTSKTKARDAEGDVKLQGHLSVLIAMAEPEQNLQVWFRSWLSRLLSATGKKSFHTCRFIVKVAFESLQDTRHDSEKERQLLQMLSIFAQANGALFSELHLQHVEGFLCRDDLTLFRLATIILRFTIPKVPNLPRALLVGIRDALFGNLRRLSRTELDESVQCLWENREHLLTHTKLSALAKTTQKNLRLSFDNRRSGSDEAANLFRTHQYLKIAGSIASYCDFDTFPAPDTEDMVQMGLQEDSSPSDYVFAFIELFAHHSQPSALRIEAFRSLGSICMTKPYLFNKQSVMIAFSRALEKGEVDERRAVLLTVRTLMLRNENLSGIFSPLRAATEGCIINSAAPSQIEQACLHGIQTLLPTILELANKSHGQLALLAVEILASVNRQGLAHPGCTIATLVALETTSDSKIAEVARQSHRSLHSHHGSVLIPKLMKAVMTAFFYQKDVIGDISGYWTNPLAAKLSFLWKTSQSSPQQHRLRFLSDMCSQLGKNAIDTDFSGDPPHPLQFSVFLAGNLAFFDYGDSHELVHTIAYLDKATLSTGLFVKDALNNKIFTPETQLNSIDESGRMLPSKEDETIDPARLFVLTVSAAILSIVWETRTHLYHMSKQIPKAQKRTRKDTNRLNSTTKQSLEAGLILQISKAACCLETRGSMIEQCQRFLTLLDGNEDVETCDRNGNNDQEGGDIGILTSRKKKRKFTGLS